ncbi:hypothetical protein L7F22_045962, partial [Adiantum nelumboides]|nr:hypothetical protein [Adiantum nelumboides]
MHLEGGEGVPVMHGPMQANVVPHPLQGPLQTDGAKKKQYHGQERHVGKIREEGDFHDDDDEPPSRSRHKKRTNERRTKRSRRNSSGGSSSSSQSGRSSHGRFPKKEYFVSMAAFQDTGDDVDVFDAQPYVFNVNPDKDYDYGDAYLEGMMDDDQSMTAISYWVCYGDAMENKIDAIFVMHAETCGIEVERYLNGSVKLPKQFVSMYETCDVVFCDDTHRLSGSSKEEDKELLGLLDDALEEFQIPCDKSSEEQLMMLLDEALEEFVPTREAIHGVFVVSNEVTDIIHVNDSLEHIDILEFIAVKFILPTNFVMMR